MVIIYSNRGFQILNKLLDLLIDKLLILLYYIVVEIMSSSTNNNTSAFNLRSVLEKDKLNANNFLEWEMAVRIVLKAEGRESVLDTPLPEPLPETATAVERRARQTLEANSMQVTCLMLASMEHDFQKRFRNQDAYTIIQLLRTMFERMLD